MVVSFITEASFTQTDGHISSPLASARYRILLPAEQLQKHGVNCQIVNATGDKAGNISKEMVLGETIVVGKHFSSAFEHLWSARNKRVIVDLCDNILEHSAIDPEYAHRLIQRADALTVPSPALGKIIWEKTGRESTVIEDSPEMERREPDFSPLLPAVKLLWFGSPSNLDTLISGIGQLENLSRRIPIRIEVVTTPITGLAENFAAFNHEKEGKIELSLLPWSIENRAVALKRCHLVFIPSFDSSRKNAKSANRLIESLWAGKFVIASPVPSYLEFSEFAWVSCDLAAGIQWALENPTDVLGKIAAGQRYIAARYQAYQIGQKWLSVIAPQHKPAVLRLNLGCGDKILPGFVNVDIAPSRCGLQPDVLCDLRDLVPFDDASANEILSVHVIEHFWRWEVRDVLKEWMRVLKPGGRMIIECPNLVSACQHFLADPVGRARENKEGQRSMWVFYGDPSWKDPLMVHRWGYTPQSLAALMMEAGLVDVRQEPAQFKLREPRDMRLTGQKPI